MRILSLLERYETIRRQNPATPLWKVLFLVNRTAFVKAGAWRHDHSPPPARLAWASTLS